MKVATNLMLFGGSAIAIIVAVFTFFYQPDESYGPQPWRFQFSEVRVYRVNWDDQYSLNGIVNGSELNATRIPLDGIVLSSAQVESLRKIVMRRKPGGVIGMCSYPHHAFVFFGEEEEVVGYYDICFQCSLSLIHI